MRADWLHGFEKKLAGNLKKNANTLLKGYFSIKCMSIQLKKNNNKINKKR